VQRQKERKQEVSELLVWIRENMVVILDMSCPFHTVSKNLRKGKLIVRWGHKVNRSRGGTAGPPEQHPEGYEKLRRRA